jgi:hypothetical protein
VLGEATGEIAFATDVAVADKVVCEFVTEDGSFSISFITEGTLPVFELKGDLPTLLRVFRDRLLRPLALRLVRGGEIIFVSVDMG